MEYRGHLQTTACCMFLPMPPSGTAWVATSSHDSSVKIWDQNTAGNTHSWMEMFIYRKTNTKTHMGTYTDTVWVFSLFTLTLLPPSLHRPPFSLFRDVVSGWCWSTGFSVSQRLHQSAVCQLQLWPPPHPGGPGLQPSSEFRRSWWPGHKSRGTLLIAQKSLV